MGVFSAKLTYFSSASQYSLGTNECDYLTWFLRLPAPPARWEMSCVHPALRESLAGDQNQAPHHGGWLPQFDLAFNKMCRTQRILTEVEGGWDGV